jgi:hypothetical protein
MNNLPSELILEIRKRIPNRDLPDALVSGIVPPLAPCDIKARYLKAIDPKILEFIENIKRSDTLLWKSICWITRMLSKQGQDRVFCVTKYLDNGEIRIRQITEAQYLFVRLSGLAALTIPDNNGQQQKKLFFPNLTQLTSASFVVLLFPGDNIERKRMDSYYIGSRVQVSFYYHVYPYTDDIENFLEKLKKCKITNVKHQEYGNTTTTYGLLPLKEIMWLCNAHHILEPQDCNKS